MDCKQADILKVAIVQNSLIWGDVDKNLYCFENALQDIDNDVDLIVLPEMFTSGFLMDEKCSIALKHTETLAWMQQTAIGKNTTIIGSIIVEEAGNYYNRLYVVDKNGVVGSYDKRHLFRMGEENNHFSAGNKRLVFTLNGWRICPLICYDLRFPVWSRNQNDYDLLLYVANWPHPRRKVWNTLLQARAIENQCYVVGVNRVGTDAKNLEYSGGSMVINAKGDVVKQCEDNKSEVVVVAIDLLQLNKFRRKFAVANDADSFQIM